MLPVTAEIAWNQTDFAYRKEPVVNQSSLKKILDSPAHYQAALKNKMIPTPAMKIGTAAHCLVLDGQTAGRVIAIVGVSVTLDGLQITRGFGSSVSAMLLLHATWDKHR